MGDSALFDMPSSRARSSNRNLRSHVNTAIKSEASMYGSDDEDGEGEDEDDFVAMMNQQGFQGGPQASGSTGGRRAESNAGPSRTSKSRVKGESSQKRKEQNRIAQRAFRKRQKAYFIDLEKEVIEKTSKIQTITKSNQSLMEMMERLQRENIALKAAKAPNFAGVPFSPKKLVSDEDSSSIMPGVTSSSSGMDHIQETGIPLGTDTEEDILVSVNDLAERARVPSRAGSSSSSSTVISPIATAPSGNKNHKKPVIRKSKKTVSDKASLRKLSSRSGGSISQTSSVLAASTSPRQMPSDNFDTVPEPRRRRATAGDGVRVTEVINNPTWGMNEYLPPVMPKSTIPITDSTGGNDSALEISPTSPISAWNFTSGEVNFAQMHQQQQQSYYQPPLPQTDPQQWSVQQGQDAIRMHHQEQPDRDDKLKLARRYSEALKRHHAGPLMGQLRASSISSPIEADRPHTAETAKAQNQGVFAFNDMGLVNGGVFNAWQWNGQGYADGQRIPFTKDGIDIDMRGATDKQNFQVEVRQPMTAIGQAGDDGRMPSSSLPSTNQPPQGIQSAPPQIKAFADMIPGLKNESNGTIMPFTGVLTPIEGLGPLGDNPFGPPPPGALVGQNIWRDLDDLNASTFGLEDMSNIANSANIYSGSPASVPFNL